jgi:hypothetical protein
MSNPSNRTKLNLIAYDELQPIRSFIVKTFTPEQSEKLIAIYESGDADYNSFDFLVKESVDLGDLDSELFGKGFEVFIGKRVGSVEEAKEESLNIDLPDGQIVFFDAILHVRNYPHTEGKFVPGIYDTENNNYYEAKNVHSFMDTFLVGIDGYCPTTKLIFMENGVKFVELTDEKYWSFYPRFPFTCFDVNCPFCNKLVLTYEPDKNHYNQCGQVEYPCPHYVCDINRLSGGYDTDPLNYHGFEYRFDKTLTKLYLKTKKGNWEQVLICQVGKDELNTIHSEDDYFVFSEVPTCELERKEQVILVGKSQSDLLFKFR